MARPIVIVGASLAGLRAAQALRGAGHEGEVVVVGAEERLPYTRPPLSKELLAGVQEAEQCALPSQKVDAEWRLGTRATGLDLERREVALGEAGERLAYDKLLIATGARPRRWPGAPIGFDGVFMLRDLDDALALRAAFAERPRLAVVGAGFIGCEVAATARKLGLEVTLIDVAHHPMTALGAAVGERCAEMHRAHGVQLRLGSGVDGFEGAGRIEAVRLADGTRVEADVAVVALGAIPNTEWLADSGLELQPGVVCDATLAARDAQDVFCAGDAAAWPHPMADGALIRIEHWTNAAEQGAAAARNLLAAPEDRTPYAAVPYFWSDQYDVKIQSVGLPARAERVTVLEASPEGDRLVLGGERGGRLVAAIGFNAARRLAFYRGRLAAMPPIDEVVAAVRADEKALGPATAGVRPVALHDVAVVSAAAPGVQRNGPDPSGALVLVHGDWGPPGLLAEWLGERGIPYDLHRTYVGEPMPDPAGYAFVASLGSNRNPRDTGDPAVAAELVLLGRAIEEDVPVLGLCFGGQALAAALGGEVETAPAPELGWTEIETDEPELVPPGPWLEWHYERFSVPPGATEIARTAVASQAFRHGRHLGVQFHPESTVEIVERWAESDAERLAALGHGDGGDLIAATPEEREAARAAAFALFDGFLERANDPAASAAAVRRG